MAHPNKGVRKNAAALQADPVAGSMGFTDAARGVLTLKGSEAGAILAAPMVNYGSPFEVELAARKDGGRFLGFKVSGEGNHGEVA